MSRVALGFLAAFVAWNFLSITWADVQGIAGTVRTARSSTSPSSRSLPYWDGELARWRS